MWLVLIINLYARLRSSVLVSLLITLIPPLRLQGLFSVSKDGFCVRWFDNLLTNGAQAPMTCYLKLTTSMESAVVLFPARRCTKLFSVSISTLLIDHFDTWKGCELLSAIALYMKWNSFLICSRRTVFRLRWRSTSMRCFFGSFNNDCRSNLRSHLFYFPTK